MEWASEQSESPAPAPEAVSECAVTVEPGRTRRRDRPSLSVVVAVALVSSIVGGLLVAAAMPGYISARIAAQEPRPAQFPAPSAASYSYDVSPAVSVAKKLRPAVVGIVNKAVAGYDLFGRAYTEERSGSGVIFDANGYIVTNNHVIEDNRELKVFLWDGRTLPATVVGADPPTDIAVIKVDAQQLPTAEFGDSDKLQIGELAVAIGNPLGMEFNSSVTQGVISGLDRTLKIGEETFRLIQTDAVINPGNSGGPLANAAGQVIGINTMKISSAEGMGFAIPINTARNIINQLLSRGRVSRPWLGIQLIDKPTARQYGYEISFEKGVYVVEVVAGGPAAKAGIRKDDIIETIDGKEIADAASLKAILGTHQVGDTVYVGVRRKDRLLTLSVVLGEMPQR
ncbi:MAG: trypsin-like peptidase domain-containing protein [Firmicutes bacterium]|nr:trypsin-like peptidase domain-containing protein [Bacillota bacterium]